MKNKDLKTEIKTMDIKALKAKTKALHKELDDLILDKNISKLKDLKSISKKKKELARVLTVLKQKELIEKLETKVTERKEEVDSSAGIVK